MNVLAILVATILSMLIGMFWYGMAGFGKPWMKMVGLKKKDMKSSPGMMIFALLISALTFTILAYFVDVFRIVTPIQGVALAALLWLGFIAPKDMSPILWQKKPLRLFLINSSYNLVTLVIGAILFAIW